PASAGLCTVGLPLIGQDLLLFGDLDREVIRSEGDLVCLELSNGVTDALHFDVETGEKRGHVHVNMTIKGKSELSALDLGGVFNCYNNHLPCFLVLNADKVSISRQNQS